MRENRKHGLMREGRVKPVLYSTGSFIKKWFDLQFHSIVEDLVDDMLVSE